MPVASRDRGPEYGPQHVLLYIEMLGSVVEPFALIRYAGPGCWMSIVGVKMRQAVLHWPPGLSGCSGVRFCVAFVGEVGDSVGV